MGRNLYGNGAMQIKKEKKMSKKINLDNKAQSKILACSIDRSTDIIVARRSKYPSRAIMIFSGCGGISSVLDKCFGSLTHKDSEPVIVSERTTACVQNRKVNVINNSMLQANDANEYNISIRKYRNNISNTKYIEKRLLFYMNNIDHIKINDDIVTGGLPCQGFNNMKNTFEFNTEPTGIQEYDEFWRELNDDITKCKIEKIMSNLKKDGRYSGDVIDSVLWQIQENQQLGKPVPRGFYCDNQISSDNSNFCSSQHTNGGQTFKMPIRDNGNNSQQTFITHHN